MTIDPCLLFNLCHRIEGVCNFFCSPFFLPPSFKINPPEFVSSPPISWWLFTSHAESYRWQIQLKFDRQGEFLPFDLCCLYYIITISDSILSALITICFRPWHYLNWHYYIHYGCRYIFWLEKFKYGIFE